MPGQAKTGAPRVYYVGWLGQQNLGDEAMFTCITQLFSDWKFVGPALEPLKPWSSRWRRPAYDAVMLECGTLINRSGSVLRELKQR